MKLTPHQVDALIYLARIPPGYKTDVQVKAVGLGTARALERLGLIKLRVELEERRVGYGPFGRQGSRVETYADATATLTALGRSVVAELS
jgi:hypothetical protein